MFRRSMFWLLLLLSVGLSACGPGPPPPLPTSTPVIIRPESCELEAGSTVSFSISGTFPEGTRFKWEAQHGTFRPDDAVSTSYTAASLLKDEEVTVSVSVTTNGGTTPYFVKPDCLVKADPNAISLATAQAQGTAGPSPEPSSTVQPDETPTQPPASEPPTPTIGLTPTPLPTEESGALPAPLPLTPSSATAPGPDDVLIAVVSTFTGIPPLRGLDIFRAGQIIAEDAIWDQQLAPLGKTVWVVAHDDQGSPARGVEIARQLVDDQRYIAVVGHNRSGVLEQALPIYNARGLPVITVAATNKELTTGPDNSNGVLTRVVGRDDIQGKAAADYISDELSRELVGRLNGRPPRIYVVYDSSTYGVGLRDEFLAVVQSAEGVEAYDEARVREIVNRVKAEATHVVFFPGYDDQVAVFLKALSELYDVDPVLARPIVLGTDGVDTPDLAARAGPAAVDLRYTSVYMSEDELKEREREQGLWSITERYRGLFGTPPASLLGESSDGMLICLTALGRAAADGVVTRDEMRVAIRNFPPSAPFKGRTGNYSFTSQGDPGQSYYYVRKVVSDQPADWDKNETVKQVAVKLP